jgi:hypothetical protein
MYLRCEDQGQWMECDLDKVKNIKPIKDNKYVQMQITLKDGTKRYADNIHFADHSIFSG